MEETVDLSSQDLYQVPGSIFPLSCSVKRLNLDYNEITDLPKELFDSNILFLSVNGNSLKALPNEINNLKSLAELYVIENCLESLPDNLCSLCKLIKLHLTGNHINGFPNQFHLLCNLTELIAHENEITILPSEFGLLTHLTYLDLSNNLLTELPESFGLLKNLKELNLSNNILKTLPNSFERLPSLEVVDLTNNEIKIVPNKFLSSKLMVKLLMNENCLTGLPEWLSDAENIKELCVACNDLLGTSFPENFGSHNFNIELINLSGNNLTTLPESFGNLKNLQYLDLGSSLDEPERNRFIANGNKLVNLPNSFTELKNLIKLEIDENELCELPTNFGNLLNLVYLDLCHNNLKILPDSFCLLRSLNTCILSMNYLIELPQDFGMLNALEDLKIDNNKLTELPKSFSNLTTLTSLDLYNNNLKEIPEALSYFKQLKQLDIRENDFGLALDKIPQIFLEPTYLSRKPEFENNWRGRKRPDISENSWVESKEDVVDESKLNDSIIYSASIASSSLWRKHGQSNVRSPSSKNNRDSLENGHDSSEQEDSTTVEEEDLWDKDIFDQSKDQNEDFIPIDFDSNLNTYYHAFRSCASSCSSTTDREQFEELSDWESDCDMPNTFRKIYRHPLYDEKKHTLVPSDLHVNRITVQEVWRPFEDGQFDDA